MTPNQALQFSDRLLSSFGPDSALEAEIVWAVGGEAASVFGSFTDSVDEALRLAVFLVGPGASQTLMHKAVVLAWESSKDLTRSDWPRWLPRAIVAQALYVKMWRPPETSPRQRASVFGLAVAEQNNLANLDLDL